MQRSQGRGFERREWHGNRRSEANLPANVGFTRTRNKLKLQTCTVQPLNLRLVQTDFEIQGYTSVRFFGLTFDSSLSRLPHNTILCGKLSRTSFALRTLYYLLGFLDTVQVHGILLTRSTFFDPFLTLMMHFNLICFLSIVNSRVFG